MFFLLYLCVFSLRFASDVFGAGAISIQVDFDEDTLSNITNCFPISNGRCNLRSAWDACSNLSASTSIAPCTINMPDSEDIFVSFGALFVQPTMDVTLNGNDCNIYYKKNSTSNESTSNNLWTSIDNDDFPRTTGYMTNTVNANKNYETGCVSNVCYGDTIQFSGCDKNPSAFQDSYFRLFNQYDIEVASNDDTCGIISRIIHTVEDTAMCGDYCLHMGCFGIDSCESVYVTASIAKAEVPAQIIDNNKFPLITGTLSNTSNATQNTASACVDACQGDVIMFSGCGNTTNSTIFRLYNNDTKYEVAMNDDYCDAGSQIIFLVEEVECASYCLHVGCSEDTSCSATVEGLYVDNPTIPDIEVYGDFPITTVSMEDTDSARTNYTVACLTACQYDILTFSSCGGDTSSDTFFRLFHNGVEVAWNEDACGYSSKIVYPVMEGGCGLEYCLHIGCSENIKCATTVNAYIDNQMGTLSNFFIYQQPNGSSSFVPSVALNNIALHGFGSNLLNGGTVYIDGDINLDMDNVYIANSIGIYGGAMYISNVSTGDIFISNCTFFDNVANIGGGVYLDRNLPSVHVYNTTFEYCQSIEITTRGHTFAEIGGGGIFANTLVKLYVDNSSFVDCSGLVGGGVYLHLNNSFSLITNSMFKGCYSEYDGGGIALFQYNNNVSMSGNIFDGCSSVVQSVGAGIGIGYFNGGVTISRSLFTKCASRAGAGIGILLENEDLLVQYNVFRENAAINGGAMFIGSNHFDGKQSNTMISNCEFVECNGYFAGAIQFTHNVDGVTIANSNFRKCTGYVGGAIANFVATANTNIVNVSVTEGYAVYYGGFLAAYDSNSGFSFTNVTVTNSTAAYAGGGAFAFLTNSADITMNNVQVHNCSTEYGDGGAMLFSQSTANLVIKNTVLTNNRAGGGGGCIAIGNDNTFILLAGVQCSNNQAASGGGGIYFASNNQQVAMIDYGGYDYYKIIETVHPIISDGNNVVIFTETVTSDSLVSSYLINFDPTTSLAYGCFASFYDDASKTILYASFEGDFPGVSAPPFRIPSNTFYVELTCEYDDNMYGLVMYAYPVLGEPMQPTSATNNVVSEGSGGGIALDYTNQFPVLANVVLNNNAAANSGGGMYMRNMNTGATLDQCRVKNNSAVDGGGGIWISSSHAGIAMLNTSIVDNVVLEEGRGGGIGLGIDNGIGVLETGNSMMIDHCLISGNIGGAGGGMFLADTNVVDISNCAFESNFASTMDGGAIMLDNMNQIAVSTTSFHANQANGNGGAIGMHTSNALSANDCIFEANGAGSLGGGISVESNSLLILGDDVDMTYNNATTAGGAISIVDSPLWSMSSAASWLNMSHNVAPRGSAVFLKNMLQPDTSMFGNVNMKMNEASVGGTVYWLLDEDMTVEPQGLDSSTVIFDDNIATYGPVSATQGVRLLGPDKFLVTQYGVSLTPPLIFQLYDAYGHSIPINGTTSVTAAIVGDINCTTRPFLSGVSMVGNGVSLYNGAAVFDGLSVVCSPGGWLDIEFTAELGDLNEIPENVGASYYISNTTRLQFRDCVAGEYESNGECVTCAAGTYNLYAYAECQSCYGVEGIKECYGNQIVLDSGYWRRHDTNAEVLQCPLAADSCLGNNATGTDSCGVGYGGELCAVCGPGYFLKEHFYCEPCTTTQMLSPTLIIYICIFGVLFLSAVGSVLFYKNSLQEPLKDDNPEVPRIESVNPLPVKKAPSAKISKMDAFFGWFRMNYDRLISKMKIVVATFQVISVVGVIVDVSMPVSYNRFVNGLKFLNLSIAAAFPLNCSTNFSFIDTLVMVTLAPIGFFCLLVIAFVISYYRARMKIQSDTHRKRGDKQRKFDEIKSRYLGYVFYVTYLVLPSVTTTIFQMFICTNVDPGGEDSDENDYYLTADMSISCSSDYFWNGVAYASVMILVYPIGIPLMYFILLRHSQSEIRNRDVIVTNLKNTPPSGEQEREKDIRSDSIDNRRKNEADEKEVDEDNTDMKDHGQSYKYNLHLSADVMRVSFLWEAYQPKYWYWEVIETTRRLMLTAVLSVCGPGTSQQNILSILLSLLYIKIYSTFNPYGNNTNNNLAEIGQFQIYFTFLGAMIIQGNMMGSEYNNAIGYVLVFINLGIISYVLYHEWLKSQQKQLNDGSVELADMHLEDSCSKVYDEAENPLQNANIELVPISRSSALNSNDNSSSDTHENLTVSEDNEKE